jgi:RsiW-degrading membrane proteinase PrsW (M82 family)
MALEFTIIETVAWAIAGGVIPTLFWLRFWLKKDNLHPEPRGMLALVFFGGAFAMIVAAGLQQALFELFSDNTNMIIAFAGIEEILKYIVAAGIAFGSAYLDEPIDYSIYLITAALGFAALENTLYLIDPLKTQTLQATLAIGNIRFLGATVLHALASGVIGLALAFTFRRHFIVKFFALIIGLLTSITLHSLFNFFIIGSERGQLGITLAILWVTLLVVLMLVGKVRKFSSLY